MRVATPLILLALAAGASANDLSSDYPGGGIEVEPPVHVPPPPCCPPPGRNELTTLLASVVVGAPERYGALTVYPVRRERGWGDPLSPRTLEQALRRGCLAIDEQGLGTVNRLTARNRCGDYVFLMAGETVYGGKQDRFVAEDGLLAPMGSDVWIPVYCSERGRWDERPTSFVPGAAVASPELRRKMAADSSQEEVWSEIAREARARGASSPTGRYGQLFDQSEGRGRVQPYVDRICPPIFSQRRTIGAVFVLGGRIVAADLFSGEGLFRAELPKLVASHAMESWAECRACDPGPEAVEAFLGSFAAPSAVADLGTYGAGRRYRVATGQGSGQVLAFDGEVIHATLLAGGGVMAVPAR